MFKNLQELIQLKEKLQEDELYEMANLNQEATGIIGFIYISTEQGSHAPRVKYYKKTGKGQPNFSVSISDSPEILVSSGMSKTEINNIEKDVFKFVVLNKEKLLKFWNEGTTYDQTELIQFLNSFTKV